MHRPSSAQLSFNMDTAPEAMPGTASDQSLENNPYGSKRLLTSRNLGILGYLLVTNCLWVLKLLQAPAQRPSSISGLLLWELLSKERHMLLHTHTPPYLSHFMIMTANSRSAEGRFKQCFLHLWFSPIWVVEIKELLKLTHMHVWISFNLPANLGYYSGHRVRLSVGCSPCLWRYSFGYLWLTE
ncbi:hypothetical protein O6H91_10G078900 [Diphasiastrum complanatum]|uniref:Uncharacterized protein n=1 Tax=Diphasiastrum complanatum TaxID=34168 RepID=A0ACC2CIP0_DIPCM|nr:hypothetical protein O6H91_10G078900 [Diphasiastrum complanatum]